jgi:hypothetical protein
VRANRLALALSIWSAACGLAAACGGGSDPDAAPRPDAYIPAGQYMASWTVNGMTGQAACAAVGAENISVEMTTLNGSPGESDSFSCASGMGLSQEHTPREFTIRFTLRGHGETLGVVDVPGTITIVDMDTITIPPVDFTVSTTGGFSMMLDANAPGPNCQPETAMPLAGAGITEWQIELRTPPTGGACVPTQIVVGDGATSGTTGGTFTLACPGPTVLPCLETDQLITFDGLPAATYLFDIKGFEGPNACYIKASQVDVVGGDVVDDLGPVAVILDTANTNCVSP